MNDLDVNNLSFDDFSKKNIGLFPDEQELMLNLGLYFDLDILEHFDYYSFDDKTNHHIHGEYKKMKEYLSNHTLLDSIEQFWFAYKSGTELEKSLINNIYSQLSDDFPLGEIYVMFSEGYISYQIVFMPTAIFPYLTSLMLLQNETFENKEFISKIINRFELQQYYDKLESMKN